MRFTKMNTPEKIAEISGLVFLCFGGKINPF